MKLGILRSPESIHIRKWVKFLLEEEIEIYLYYISRDSAKIDYKDKYPEMKNIHLIELKEMLSANIITRALRFILRKLGFESKIHKNLANQLKYMLVSDEIDLLHVHGVQYYGQIAGYLEIPYIISIWGSDIFHRKLDQSTTAEYSACFLNAKIVESSSKHAALTAMHAFNFPNEKIHTFPWGVDLNLFNYTIYNYNKRELREQFGINDDSRYIILSQRSMKDLYNWRNTLKAAEILHKRNLNFYLIMTKGFGTSQNVVEANEFIVDHNLSDSVLVIDDFLAFEDMIKLFFVANAFLSIPNTDNIADSLIEGIAMKCYPILGEIPAYYDIFNNTNATFVDASNPVSIANGMQEAIINVTDNKIVNANYEYALDNCDWSKVVKKQKQLYEKVLELV